MNGIGPNEEERLANKRKLEADLALIRSQKAEVLRSIQQIAKKQKLGGPPTDVQHRSHESKIQHAKLDHERRKEMIFQTCTKIIQELLKNHNVKSIFLNPVSREIYPQYYVTIARPICLSDIKSKLEIKGYADVYAFRDDMRLVWANCRAFNPPGEIVRKFGDNASDQFEQKFLKYHVEASWEAEQQRHNLDMQRLDAEAKTLPDKIKEVDAELQELSRKVAERDNPPAPGPGREMTFEEKRKLSHTLGTLPGERLTRVLEIIAEGPSAPQMESEEEYELDIDALDSDTLWKLQAYVDAVVNELAAKAPKPPAPADGAAAGTTTGGGAPKTNTDGGSDSDEGVGSKGNEGSAQGGPEVDDAPKRAPGGGHDMTTFVSATGPGGAPAILKNTGQKKDVQLQNAGAWAPLSAPAKPTNADAAGGGAAPEKPTTATATINGTADGHGDAAMPAADEDNLWTEFQGREEQQRQAEEAKKALAEEERKKKEEEAQHQRDAEAEAARQAEQQEEEHKKKEEEEQAQLESQREALQKELEVMKTQGEEDHDTDLMRHAEHHSAADLEELGLGQREDEEPEPMEEI